MRTMTIKQCKHQKGQSIVEHLILWPALVFVVMFALQLGQLYKAKATVNTAALRAAREGALNNGDIKKMNRLFVESLAPLYLRNNPGAASYLLAVGRAYKENGIDPVSGARLAVGSGIWIDRISPNQSVFNAFAADQYVLPKGCEDSLESGSGPWRRTSCREPRNPTRQIPNDNLNVRSAATEQVDVGGERVDMNIQDANLLKIRAHYCVALTIPLMRAAFYQWNRTWYEFFQGTEAANHPAFQTCRNRTLRNAGEAAAGTTSRKFYIPVSADAVVRMQSPYRN